MIKSLIKYKSAVNYHSYDFFDILKFNPYCRNSTSQML